MVDGQKKYRGYNKSDSTTTDGQKLQDALKILQGQSIKTNFQLIKVLGNWSFDYKTSAQRRHKSHGHPAQHPRNIRTQ